MSAPLAGIRVLEVAVMVAVPQATQILASYGADVIKVEDTDTGEPLRFYGSAKHGTSGWYANVNAGKRSIAVDLKHRDGVDLVRKLASEADVLVEGFRTGAMDRLGLGYNDIAGLNPQIIYCSSTGFGDGGPYAARPAYDPLIQALAGWAGIQQVDGDPSLVRAMAADKVGAYNNAQAIMAALIQRSSQGSGCHIKTSMLDGNLAFVWPDVMMDHTLIDADVDHRPNLLLSYRLYTAADGWVSIAIGTDEQWRSACNALERLDLLEDERLATSAGRGAHFAQWYDAVDAMASQFPAAEVVHRLVEADVPAAPVHEPAAVYDDPHVRATGFVRESVHPVVGRMRHPRARADQFGGQLDLAPAPAWGEHTAQVLQELGYSATQIETLAASGVVRVPQ